MANENERVQSPTIMVNGSQISVDTLEALVELRVEQSVHMPATFTMRFRDPNFDMLDERLFKVADSVEILLPTAGNREISVFVGETTSIAVDQSPRQRHELVVAGLDGGHRLAHATRIRSFQNQSYLDVAKTIAQENGLGVDVSGGSWSSKPVEYLLQSGTDYAYLSELADRSGLEWWVEDETLKMAAPVIRDSVTLTWRENLARFKARFSASEQVEGVTVQGWDSAQQCMITSDDGDVLAAAAAAESGADSDFASTGHDEAKTLTGRTGGLVTASIPVESPDEATSVAKALAGRFVSSGVLARGEALGSPELRAGGTVQIEGMGDAVSGRYRVTTVEHIFGGGRPLTTRFVAGGRSPSSLVDLVGGTAPEPGRWGTAGFVIGVVTNNSDPEGQGRVRIRFPALSDQYEGAWARVATIGGGPDRGIAWLPEIEDEVVVGFDGGDLRFPLVLGGLWSGKNKPPTSTHGDLVADGKVERRMMTSAAGHRLEFGDGSDPQDRHVAVELADDQTRLRVGEDQIEVESDGGNPITIKSGATTIVIESGGGVSIKGPSITLQAEQKLSLSALDIEINADSSLKATGGGQLELGGAMAKLEASGIAEITGSMIKLN